MPDGNKHWGWREGTGVLFYVPTELLPNRHENMNQLMGPHAEELMQLDYEIDHLGQLQDTEQKLLPPTGAAVR
jgi:hypothetical protein